MTSGQNIPGNYGYNLNAISRQSPTGKFVAESMKGNGLDVAGSNLRDNPFARGASSTDPFMNRNLNLGITRLNRVNFKR